MNNILLIRFSSLGDIILTEPIARVLKSAFPDAKLSFLTKARFLPLLDMFSDLDRTYGWSGDHDSDAFLETLRQERFDLVVDLHANIRSARVRSALGVKSVRTKKEWFKRIASVKLNAIAGKPAHALQRYITSLLELGIPCEPMAPVLHSPEVAQEWWHNHRAVAAIPRDYYIIAAGAAHVTKRAPESLWAGLDRSLRNRFGVAPILIGSPPERDYLTRLAERFDEKPLSIVTEEDIPHAAAAITTAQFVVSNDSGLAHLAAALNTPVVALFGPTHPILGFAPLGNHADHYTVNEYCSPCSLHGDRKCYRSERYCFTKMQVDDIIRKFTALMPR